MGASPTINDGIVTTWCLPGDTRGKKRYVALDPAHPAASELKRLLLRIAEVYPGFTAPRYEADDIEAGQAPYRRSRLRDVRNTFGDRNRTLPLLLIYIAGSITGAAITRVVARSSAPTIQSHLWMFHAFGILRKSDVKARGVAFELDPSHPLASEIKDVLRALDMAMPLWRRIFESQRDSTPVRIRSSRGGRRKPGRWKW
jgi:hypothetical protein